VTRKIGLSREKPQYEQLFTHSFEKYRGANKRIVRPKNRWVVFLAPAANSVRARSSIGSSNLAKSAEVLLVDVELLFKSCAKVMEMADRKH
jgi:hypothetical protein